MKVALTAQRIFDQQCKTTFATKSAITGLMQCRKPDHRSACAGLAGNSSLGIVTILGRRIVNVEPSPGLLTTVMSPPIIWQNPRLITSPEPGASVFAGRRGRRLGKLLEQLAHLLRRHPDAGVRHRQRDPIAAL